MLLALEKGANCTPINLGCGKGYTIKELVNTILTLVNHLPQVVWDTSKPHGEPVRIMDMNRAKTMIGFKAKTSLEEGLKETINWYLHNKESINQRYNVFYQKSYL